MVGCVQVYLAEWHHTPVAVKVLSLDTHNALEDRRMVERLFHEGAWSESCVSDTRRGSASVLSLNGCIAACLCQDPPVSSRESRACHF